MTVLAFAPAHPFHPFDGHNTVGDAVRCTLIVASFALIMVILRTLREGMQHHAMDRWQAARFVSVGLLAGSLSLGSASRFGAPLNGYVIANIVGVAVQGYGVMGIRRAQRNGTGEQL